MHTHMHMDGSWLGGLLHAGPSITSCIILVRKVALLLPCPVKVTSPSFVAACLALLSGSAARGVVVTACAAWLREPLKSPEKNVRFAHMHQCHAVLEC